MATMTNELQQRTFSFALRCVRLVNALPKSRSADSIGNQLLRSASSVGANYRAARRARTTKEFIARLGVVEEEADESVYWLELIAQSGMMPAKRVDALRVEANEIVAIIVASIRTAKKKLKQKSKSE